jgi:hypothetical protein
MPRLPFNPFAELIESQRPLALYGLGLLLLALPLAMQAVDPRTAGRRQCLGEADQVPRLGRHLRAHRRLVLRLCPARSAAGPRLAPNAAVLIAAASFELAWIGWQAGQRPRIAFQQRHAVLLAMYALMGLFAVMLIGTTLPLAWEIGRRPGAGLRRDFVAAVVIGLVLTFLLGGGLGGYMSAQPGHASAPGRPRSLVRLEPQRRRPSHRPFPRNPCRAGDADPRGAAGGLAAPGAGLLGARHPAYVGLTLAVFAQAVAGRPLLPL